MSEFIKAICSNLREFTPDRSLYQFPELEFTIEKGKNFQIIDERNFHFDAEFFEEPMEETPGLKQQSIPLKKDLTGKVIRSGKGDWEISVKFISQSHGILLQFYVKKCGIYINESASGFSKEVSMKVGINSQQFKSYNEELFTLGSELKTKKIREFWQETHKDREIKLDLTQFTQNILSIETKQLWGGEIDGESSQKPMERKYPKRIVLKECVINEKKISVKEIADIVSEMKVQEDKTRKQQEEIRLQRMKEREDKRKKEEAELAQKGSQIQELAKFYKEQKIADKLYSLTTSALSSLPPQSSNTNNNLQQQNQQLKSSNIQYYYQNPLSLEYIYGGRGSEFMMQEFESSLAWGNEQFGYKGIIQKQLREIKEKDKKKKIKGIRPIALEHKEKHAIRAVKKIKLQ